jgi:hypothetical protein
MIWGDVLVWSQNLSGPEADVNAPEYLQHAALRNRSFYTMYDIGMDITALSYFHSSGRIMKKWSPLNRGAVDRFLDRSFDFGVCYPNISSRNNPPQALPELEHEQRTLDEQVVDATASMRVRDDNQDNENDSVGAEEDSTGEDDSTDDESGTGILFDGESLDGSLGSMFDNEMMESVRRFVTFEAHPCHNDLFTQSQHQWLPECMAKAAEIMDAPQYSCHSKQRLLSWIFFLIQ